MIFVQRDSGDIAAEVSAKARDAESLQAADIMGRVR